MSNPHILTGIDIFAGAGGFSLAARESGIDIKAAVENNKYSCKTYRRNFIDGHETPPVLFEEDINDIKPSDLLTKIGMSKGECSILFGGPPCQGYSAHRIRDTGVDDPRNKLLIRYFDYVRAIHPKTFIVENVSGLLWSRHAKYLNLFLRKAKRAGYKVYGPHILNAKDYGVPQNRKRVFIVGIRKDLNMKLNWPPRQTHHAPNSDEVLTYGQCSWVNASAVFEKPSPKNDPNAIHMNHTKELVEVFRSTPKNGGSRFQSNRVLPCHKDHSGHKDVYGRIDPNKPGPTMTTGCINPSKGRFLHPTKNHGISVRHAARFQAFPDDFIFEDNLSACAIQVGNAVPIELGKAVIGTVIGAFNILTTLTEMESISLSNMQRGQENKAYI